MAGLEARGYAVLQADEHDGRRQNVVLTENGQVNRAAVIDVIHELNREMPRLATPEHLDVAEQVLQAVIDAGPGNSPGR